jgi:uncharacterized membrane protein
MKKRTIISRVFTHLFTLPSRVNCHFSTNGLSVIEQAIAYGETRHAGEIRFVVETNLHPMEVLYKKTPRKRAIELFGQLSIWDTEHNNGVLLYLLMADKDIEIVADRGIASKVPQHVWESICHVMEAKFKVGEFEQGVISGIEQINAVLETHFPLQHANKNELPNTPLLI